jgi:Lsr2
MKEIAISTWDDLHYHHDGKRVAAEPGPPVLLQLDSQKVELELTAEHRQQLRDVLAPYFAAGQKPESQAKRTPRNSSGMGAARVYNKAMRAFADEHGLRYSVGRQGKVYWPPETRAAYATYLESQGSEAARR